MSLMLFGHLATAARRFSLSIGSKQELLAVREMQRLSDGAFRNVNVAWNIIKVREESGPAELEEA